MIPHFDTTSNRFTFRICFVERCKLQVMVLDLNGQTLEPRAFRQTFRDRPTLEHAVLLESKVKVMTTCPMLFYDKDRHLKSDRSRRSEEQLKCVAIQQAQHKYLRDDQVRLLRRSPRNTSLVQKRCRNERPKAKTVRESVTIYPENGKPASSPMDGFIRPPSHFAALPSSPNRKRGIGKAGRLFWKGIDHDVRC